MSDSKPIHKIYFILFILFSGSGNSAELTTMKDLKRSKNKGRKKKAKTRQLRQNNPTESVQEAKLQGPKPTNDTLTKQMVEQQITLITDQKDSENVPANVENKIENISDKPTIGKLYLILY